MSKLTQTKDGRRTVTLRLGEVEAFVKEYNLPVPERNPYPDEPTTANAKVAGSWEQEAARRRAQVLTTASNLTERLAAAETTTEWDRHARVLDVLANEIRDLILCHTVHHLHTKKWCPGVLFRLSTWRQVSVLAEHADPWARRDKEALVRAVRQAGLTNRPTYLRAYDALLRSGAVAKVRVTAKRPPLRKRHDSPPIPEFETIGEREHKDSTTNNQTD